MESARGFQDIESLAKRREGTLQDLQRIPGGRASFTWSKFLTTDPELPGSIPGAVGLALSLVRTKEKQQMHAQQLPHAAHAPPIPMMPHPGLPGPPNSAASLLGLSGALGGPGPHPLSMLGAKPDLHRDEVKSSSGQWALLYLFILH
uniref:Uncharacterized protein n=1 Tax=Timema cristinae TaxID=61476 RepID=A0A7R9CRC5_TIMCR|nr:unnamed protein product [Timema cristinae]